MSNLISSSSTETELKFQIRPGDLTTLRTSSIFAAPSVATLRSVYFDTVGQNLHKAGFSLRVREANGAFTQTVKGPKGFGLFDREEWESEIDNEKPDRLVWKGTPIANLLEGESTQSLRPIFSTTVKRTVGVVVEGDNVVEVSLDEGKIEAGECSEPILELELELKSGGPAALFAIARKLGAQANLRLSFSSKAERGYRLARSHHPTAHKAHSAAMPAISEKITAAEAFGIVVRDCLVQTAVNAELLQNSSDGEVLHQLRVALRRLRAGLIIFDPILPPDRTARLKSEAKWAAGKLAEARNLDVLIATMRNALNKHSSERQATLAASRRATYNDVRSVIASKRFAALLLDCAEWVEVDRDDNTPMDPAAIRLRDGDAATFANRSLKRLRRKLRKRGRHLRTLSPKARHSVRIKAKNLRYAVEFFAGCFGDRRRKRHKKFLATLSWLQDALGKLNDLTYANSTLSKATADRNDLAPHAGNPTAECDFDEVKLLKKAVEAFKRWRRIKSFWRETH